jgi:hypothetical protein
VKVRYLSTFTIGSFRYRAFSSGVYLFKTRRSIDGISPSTAQMTASTPLKLSNLRKLLAAQPQKEIVRAYLYQTQKDLCREAVLVTLYRKWSNLPPYGLSEIGIATFRQGLNYGFPYPAGPHAEMMLEHVWCMHLRIRSNAHLPSDNAAPDAFHFGTSVFVTYDEACTLLNEIWHQPMDESRPGNGYRPIIYISHGDNDAQAKVRTKDFDFVPARIDTTVAILNAQDIAVQAKVTSKGDAPIEYILPIFKIIPFHTNNTGNAATYIMVIAFLSALRPELYGSADNPHARPGQKGPSSSKSAMSVMRSLMERPTPAAPFGVTTYCWRCSSYLHVAAECPNTDFVCTKCLGSNSSWRNENARTHMEGLCVFK